MPSKATVDRVAEAIRAAAHPARPQTTDDPRQRAPPAPAATKPAPARRRQRFPPPPATPCRCRTSCRCWAADVRPGEILACRCPYQSDDHPRPTGCRYEPDNVDGWVKQWPGETAPVIICLTHGGMAPPAAYETDDCTEPCQDAHLRRR